MKRQPHPESLLGSSFRRMEYENIISRNKSREKAKLLDKLDKVDANCKSILNMKISFYQLACSLGLLISLIVGAIPWIALIICMFLFTNIFSTISFSVGLILVITVIGILLSYVSGRYIFRTVILCYNPNMDEELNGLLKNKESLEKEIESEYFR